MKGFNKNFYSGNLSELLGDYLLSHLGIATPVRRQFDTGVDFYCNIMNDESDYLTFSSPFMIQIKSASVKKVSYGNKDALKWKREHIVSLFRSEVPFFIGFIDKEKFSLSIYDTTGLWQLYKNGKVNCSQIILKPSKKEEGEERGNHQSLPIENWNGHEGDGFQHVIDLGAPLITISYEDIQGKENKEILRNKREILKAVIDLEKVNIMYRNLGVMCFREIKNNKTNVLYIRHGAEFRGDYDSNQVSQVYNSLRAPLVSLMINLYGQNEREKSEVVKSVLKWIPDDGSYKELKKGVPQLFDWIE
ncbi:MAG TPA: hypothetical protein VF487_07685 [Chitinophagaceae bacterium]